MNIAPVNTTSYGVAVIEGTFSTTGTGTLTPKFTVQDASEFAPGGSGTLYTNSWMSVIDAGSNTYTGNW